MKSKYIWWGVGILLFLGLANRRVFSGIKANPSRVLLLGDSLTSSPGYCETVKRRLGTAIRCVSYPGNGVKDIHDQSAEAIASFKPTTVVVLAGVNDLASGRGVPYTTAALDALYRDLNSRGIAVVAVKLTPWREHRVGRNKQDETNGVNEFIRRHPIPAKIVSTNTIEGLARDKLHLTRRGGVELGQLVSGVFA